MLIYLFLLSLGTFTLSSVAKAVTTYDCKSLLIKGSDSSPSLGFKGSEEKKTSLLIEAVEDSDFLNPYTEFVEIRNGTQQLPNPTIIPTSMIGNYTFKQGIDFGDLVEMEIFPEAYAELNRKTDNQNREAAQKTGNNPSSRNQGGLVSNSFNSDRNLLGDRNKSPLQVKDKSSNELLKPSNEDILKYINRTYADATSDVRALIAKTIESSSSLWREVIQAKNSNFVTKVNYIISNNGAKRFFWFRPVGSSRLVPARVLDIHRYVKVSTATILVEFLSENNREGQRVRQVAEISPEELSTMVRSKNEKDEYSIERARELFFETLTPMEILISS